MVAQQSRAKKGKVGNGRKSMSQSIARNNNTATQDDENISINLILAILSTGIMAFIGILTETLTNVLFPGLMAEFHVDTSTVQWLTTGYLLTVALVTPLSSYFKRKLKLRTIFLTAIVLCITGCLMAACTLNFPMLMTARILQGAGTGIALPLMFNIILEQSSKKQNRHADGRWRHGGGRGAGTRTDCGRSCRYVHAVALDFRDSAAVPVCFAGVRP